MLREGENELQDDGEIVPEPVERAEGDNETVLQLLMVGEREGHGEAVKEALTEPDGEMDPLSVGE